MSADFTPDQKRYLEGFMTGVQVVRSGRGVPGASAPASIDPTGPDAPHIRAQAVAEKAGKKLVDQEKWKRAEHPFDAYARLKDQAEKNEYPKPEDNFRWRYYGLFYVAPAQNSYMCRLRIPNGILNHWQFAGLADLTERCAGPYAHVTTRANLQIREIPAENAVAVVEGLQDLGLCSRGSGADNIRNVTGSATAGIDAQELYDTRPLAREWHFHILNSRTLYGLPRKFNVAFDGGGTIPTLEESNDIGFQAARLKETGEVRFRVMLGGISGHKDLARDTGVYCLPEECTEIADAMVRVFIDHGDRTNRNKARLKYVLDAWGFEKFLAATEEKLGKPLMRLPTDVFEPRQSVDRAAHVGVHPQKQAGFNWIGVALPVGRLTLAQMRGLAALSSRLGDGDIRLTVWQNLLISGVPDKNLEAAKSLLADLGLSCQASRFRLGLVACTGATGCKFAASHTKEDALRIADYIDAKLAVDQPINVHLTGCHHSCAQHYIGDIGLIGAKVPINDEGDTVEGYDIVVGGGFGDRAKIGRELWSGVKATDCPSKVEALLRAWLCHRSDVDETFQSFTERHPAADLRALAEQEITP